MLWFCNFAVETSRKITHTFFIHKTFGYYLSNSMDNQPKERSKSAVFILFIENALLYKVIKNQIHEQFSPLFWLSMVGKKSAQVRAKTENEPGSNRREENYYYYTLLGTYSQLIFNCL